MSKRFAGFIHAIYGTTCMVSRTNQQVFQEEVMLADFDSIIANPGQNVPHRFVFRLKGGRESQEPYRTWLSEDSAKLEKDKIPVHKGPGANGGVERLAAELGVDPKVMRHALLRSEGGANTVGGIGTLTGRVSSFPIDKTDDYENRPDENRQVGSIESLARTDAEFSNSDVSASAAFFEKRNADRLEADIAAEVASVAFNESEPKPE